ncbi:hypothetical protein AAY53_17740 [Vibrio metoecus]|nr:hypothetical protein AAY53_17740 [Vibrio metoecus]
MTQTSNFKLQTSNFKLQTSNFKLQTSNFKLQTSNECSAFAIRGWVRTVFNSLQLGCRDHAN